MSTVKDSEPTKAKPSDPTTFAGEALKLGGKSEDEVRRMDRNDELLFLKGSDPLLARRVNYLTDVEFRSQFDPNPQHQVVAP